jgi:hypothetical protein
MEDPTRPTDDSLRRRPWPFRLPVPWVVAVVIVAVWVWTRPEPQSATHASPLVGRWRPAKPPKPSHQVPKDFTYDMHLLPDGTRAGEGWNVPEGHPVRTPQGTWELDGDVLTLRDPPRASWVEQVKAMLGQDDVEQFRVAWDGPDRLKFLFVTSGKTAVEYVRVHGGK